MGKLAEEIQKEHNEILDACPHCGHPLSPWQQVLLSVDRVLVCNNCWYRIILDTPIQENPPEESENDSLNPKE